MKTIESFPAQKQTYQAVGTEDQKILAAFTPEQQVEIRHKLRILSTLAYFIGKDFRIPVELNEPGQGWHWDFEHNVIRVDPKDLLEKPMDYLRFVICHEGGHRRISRTEFIPLEVWQQPGFSFLMNAIEDPRDNNFVAEAYPRFREQMKLAYEHDLDFEAKAKDEAVKKLGCQPRFMQAGFEYIRLWFCERRGSETAVSPDLPDDVRQTVAATLEAARDSWWRYPSKQEADEREETIKAYAKVSYEINRDDIWPQFQKLVEADLKDQGVQELLKDMVAKAASGKGAEGRPGGPMVPKELKGKLTPEEKKALADALEKGLRAGDAAVPLDALPEGLKKKIKEFIDGLSEDEKKNLAEKAKGGIKALEGELNKELAGKLSDDPEKKAGRGKGDQKDAGKATVSAGERTTEGPIQERPASALGKRVFSEAMTKIIEDENAYERERREVLPIIDQTEGELRRIFLERTMTSWKGGFRSGKRVDVKKRIQERVKGVPAMQSEAWQKRERPKQKDYAITLLNDLSGSMAWDGKSAADLKAKIVFAEVLNRIGIRVEILGFHDELLEYQKFGQALSKDVRKRIGEMPAVAESKRCHGCKMDHNATDIGWATKLAADRLGRQQEKHKILITISDYVLEASPKHPITLESAVEEVAEMPAIKLVGIRIGEGGADMDQAYARGLGGFPTSELAIKLANLIKEVIVRYDAF
ncbi:MAG: hypothetical protein Q7R83_02825 [bacterium]|nr:hypothetical protein [bacterium]